MNYFFFVAEEVRELMARLGFRKMDEMIGRSDMLRSSPPLDHAKASSLDLSALLHLATPATMTLVDRVERHHVNPKKRQLWSGESLNRSLLEIARPALESGDRVQATLPIRNADRAVGATLSGEIARRYGDIGLAEGTISFKFTGSAGQSFGAFAARGLSLELEGEANDYLGKGLSGGRIVVHHPRAAQFIPDQTVLVGNTVLYGATSGEAYIAGIAGERFAVRNSGATAVVEGVGAHGCEYMTGGTVVVLGRIGRNFGAGMSGGLAFVLDEFGEVESQCNTAMVELATVADFGERELVRRLVEQHARLTGSARAKRELGQWERTLRHLVVIVPREYRDALKRGSDGEANSGTGAASRGLLIADSPRNARHG
jgi:glutamate synthase (NADPH/NADH) large chain/glutamate synthase (ferredoxin)